jgi:hypothetical protein
MRRRMGVFRLDPFAMHENGGRGIPPTWAGGVARPHDKPGEIIEWQASLHYPLIPEDLQDVWTMSPKSESRELMTPNWDYPDEEVYGDSDTSVTTSPTEPYSSPVHLHGESNISMLEQGEVLTQP